MSPASTLTCSAGRSRPWPRSWSGPCARPGWRRGRSAPGRRVEAGHDTPALHRDVLVAVLARCGPGRPDRPGRRRRRRRRRRPAPSRPARWSRDPRRSAGWPGRWRLRPRPRPASSSKSTSTSSQASSASYRLSATTITIGSPTNRTLSVQSVRELGAGAAHHGGDPGRAGNDQRLRALRRSRPRPRRAPRERRPSRRS